MVSETREPLSLITWAVAARPLPGQSVSGDHYVVGQIPNGVLVAVIDGLGHGPEAAAIARTAGQVFGEYASEAPALLLKRCHTRLLGTRGAAISLAVFNGQDNTLTWLGVGNVEGAFFRRDVKNTPSRVSLLVRAGVVGYQLPALRASVVSVGQGDLLIVATDGIRTEFTQEIAVGQQPQQVAERVLSAYGKATDDALVLAVNYHGTPS